MLASLARAFHVDIVLAASRQRSVGFCAVIRHICIDRRWELLGSSLLVLSVQRLFSYHPTNAFHCSLSTPPNHQYRSHRLRIQQLGKCVPHGSRWGRPLTELATRSEQGRSRSRVCFDIGAILSALSSIVLSTSYTLCAIAASQHCYTLETLLLHLLKSLLVTLHHRHRSDIRERA